jgi:mRNA interferase RelE/StbE
VSEDEEPQPYRIEAQPALVRQMRGIPQHDQARILEKIEALATDPRPVGCEKLTGAEGWRIRVGDYRVVYWIDDAEHVVVITRVGQRGSIYRRR